MGGAGHSRPFHALRPWPLAAACRRCPPPQAHIPCLTPHTAGTLAHIRSPVPGCAGTPRYSPVPMYHPSLTSWAPLPQVYLLLSCCPCEGRISGIVDVPNAVATLAIPTAIFDQVRRVHGTIRSCGAG